MSTVRSIERRLYVRRQMDRDLAAQSALAGGEAPRHMEWSGIWTGYMTFAGLVVLLLSFVAGIGFSAVSPLSGNSWASVGGGTLAWSGVMILISLFVGSWVAGRTPVAVNRRHGMMRGVTLWGLVLLSVLLFFTWVAASAATAVGSGLSATNVGAGGSNPTLATTLTNNGITLSSAQETTISSQLAAGDQTGAANTLATDAGIPAARATNILAGVPAAPAASGAATAVKHGGGALTWGIFWIALIGLGCALWGGAMGGGGQQLRPRKPLKTTA